MKLILIFKVWNVLCLWHEKDLLLKAKEKKKKNSKPYTNSGNYLKK